jgi:hypothetical protein
MDLILDTSIIIEIFGGNERVREHLKNHGNKVFGIVTRLKSLSNPESVDGMDRIRCVEGAGWRGGSKEVAG